MERPSDPIAVCAAIKDADPDVMDRDELAGLVQQVAVHQAWLDAQRVRITRRQRALADQGRAEHPKDLLAREGRQSGREARAADERERVCSQMPGFEDALAAGAVSAGHVDAIAHATRGLDESTRAEFASHAQGLLADATQLGVDSFSRACQDLARFVAATAASGSDVDELQRQREMSKVKRWKDRVSGMCHTHLELDPVRDATLWAAIDRARRQLRRRPHNGTLGWDQLQVEAVIEATAGAQPGERVVELSVLVDYDTLRDGVHPHSVCELPDGTPVPVATVRQLACEAEIIPIVLNGNGRALDVGRSSRLATEAQRQALRAMHRTCIHPDCTVPFEDCRIHHLLPWEYGGRTDLDNLAPLCESKHHHDVHEGGWTLTLTPERIATWTRPDGTIYHTGPTIDRAPHGLAS